MDENQLDIAKFFHGFEGEVSDDSNRALGEEKKHVN